MRFFSNRVLADLGPEQSTSLDWLNVSCDKCGRHGRYNVAHLIAPINH
jgi:hypothetical protein